MIKKAMGALLTGTAIVSIAPACAQTVPSDTAPAASTPRADGVDDIVVTARKRSESIQSVPVAVTAFTTATLERQQVRSLEDLNFSAPNLNIVKNTGTTNAAQIYIRGLGQDESTYHAEQPVAVYIDGVPLGKANGALLDMIEFERIEILRGPQGTLYGRNSAGGAIKFVTRRPDLDNARFVGDATVGSYGRLDLRASASLPIVTGKLAAKVDVISRDDDGYVHDLSTNKTVNTTDRQTIRGTLLWKPETATSAYLTYDHTIDKSSINLPIPYSLFGGVPVDLYGKYNARSARPDANRYIGNGASFELTHDFGPLTVLALTGYRQFRSYLAADLDGTPATSLDFEQDLHQRQFTQELQLTSNGDGPFHYVVGAFYFNENVRQYAWNILQNTYNDNRQLSRSTAVYGEFTYDIGRLSVSAGGRYTWDRKTMYAKANNLATSAALFDVTGRFKSSQFTPRVIANYKVSPDVMLYASWSKGYQTGGFANGRPTNALQAVLTFDPQTATAYELGFKSEFLDRKVRFNAAAFHNTFRNIGFSFLNGTQLSIATADVRIQGLEGELTVAPARGLSLYANLSILDGKYLKIPINPTTGLSTVGGLTLANKLKMVPDAAYKLGFDYNFLAGRSVKIGFGGNYAHSSRIYRNLGNNPAIASPPVGFLDAQVYVATPSDSVRLTAGFKNITDEYYNYQGVSGASRYYLPGRTWSLTLRGQF